MNIGKQCVKMHNEFHAVLTDAKTGEVKLKASAYNVVLDRYYARLKNENGGVTGLQLGTGTGTPAATDTALFNRLGSYSVTWGSIYYIDDYNTYRQCSRTFTESEANGNLTEIGFYCSYNSNQYLMTHAMFTDAENNPIVIPKTNADRLTITATVYVTVSYNFPDYIIPYYFARPYYHLTASLKHQMHYKSVSYPAYLPTLLYNSYDSGYQPLGRLQLASYSATSTIFNNIGNSHSSITEGFRLTSSRWTSTEQNLSITYQIRGVDIGLGCLCFPAHDVFPPISLELTQVADGTSTDFNFGVPELMPEVSVYVDNVLQDPSTYTWCGKDFTFKQAYISAHGTYLYSYDFHPYGTSSYRYNTPLAGGTYFESALESGQPTTFAYDFEEPYTVNHLCSYAPTSYPVYLYKSDDGENWTQVVALTTGSTNSVVHQDITPTTARYWKTTTGGTSYLSAFPTGNGLDMMSCFDNVQPQLRFNSAPAANAVIKIQAKSEFPIKNANWIIEPMTVDYSYDRGD